MQQKTNKSGKKKTHVKKNALSYDALSVPSKNKIKIEENRRKAHKYRKMQETRRTRHETRGHTITQKRKKRHGRQEGGEVHYKIQQESGWFHTRQNNAPPFACPVH